MNEIFKFKILCSCLMAIFILCLFLTIRMQIPFLAILSIIGAVFDGYVIWYINQTEKEITAMLKRMRMQEREMHSRKLSSDILWYGALYYLNKV